jgi:hypothetical protein
MDPGPDCHFDVIKSSRSVKGVLGYTSLQQTELWLWSLAILLSFWRLASAGSWLMRQRPVSIHRSTRTEPALVFVFTGMCVCQKRTLQVRRAEGDLVWSVGRWLGLTFMIFGDRTSDLSNDALGSPARPITCHSLLFRGCTIVFCDFALLLGNPNGLCIARPLYSCQVAAPAPATAYFLVEKQVVNRRQTFSLPVDIRLVLTFFLAALIHAMGSYHPAEEFFEDWWTWAGMSSSDLSQRCFRTSLSWSEPSQYRIHLKTSSIQRRTSPIFQLTQ